MELRHQTSLPGRSALLARALALAGLLAAFGCDTRSFIDPSEMGRFKKDPLVMPVVSQVDPMLEEGDTQWSTATEPTTEDMSPSNADYRISPNDLLDITLSDLNGPNTETRKAARVSESGNIGLPFLKEPIRAAGLTEIQLERAIVDAYKNAQLIENANVSVSVVEARGRAFWISGAVTGAGQYPILQSDFRLVNALTLARDVSSPFVTYIYITRSPEMPLPPAPRASMPGGGPATRPTTGPSSEELAPHTRANSSGGPVASAGPARVQHLMTAAEQNPQSFDGFRSPTSGTRVIRIPYEALKRGDMKYNIPIKPNDSIYVQPPEQGFYFMGGHVARPGAFTLSGQRVTLMNAIVGASMLDGLAIPQRTDIIRRVNPDHQVFVRVDLSKVFNGEEPDIYLKPGDTVIVGTNAIAPFLAAIRGGFRTSYGFGFLYDRNYAYPTQFGVP